MSVVLANRSRGAHAGVQALVQSMNTMHGPCRADQLVSTESMGGRVMEGVERSKGGRRKRVGAFLARWAESRLSIAWTNVSSTSEI